MIQWRVLAVLLALGVLVGLALYRFANWGGLASAAAAILLPIVLTIWISLGRAGRP